MITLRRIGDGEESSQSTPLIRNITEVETTQVIAGPSERVPLENITNMVNVVSRNNREMATSHHQLRNQLSTEGSPVNALPIPQRMMNDNRNYYQQCKDRNNMITSVSTQGSSQPLTTTIQTMKMQNVDGREGTREGSSGLTHEHFNDAEASTEINIVSLVNNDVSHVGVDLQKEKQKAYNREYYARNKEKIKMRRMVNGEGSSRSTPLIRKIIEVEMTRMNIEPSERVPLENITNMVHVVPRNNRDMATSHHLLLTRLSTDETPVNALPIPQRMMIDDRNYYQQCNEGDNMLTGVSTQGSSQRLRTTIQTMEMQNVDGREGTRQTSLVLTHENFNDAEPSTELNIVSLVNNDLSQVGVDLRKEKHNAYHREYYKRNKEKIKMRRMANGEGSSRSTPLTMRRMANGEGSSRSTPLITNVATVSSINDDILRQDQYDFVYDGIPTQHRLLPEQNPCVHCGAKRLVFESNGFCCMSGKIQLAYSPIPGELYELFTSDSQLGKIFRHNIRAYNTNFSFTSMGVTLDSSTTNMTSGVYTFRAHGTIYHRIDQLVPRDGQPRYLHLYFYDDQEFSHILQWPNLDRNIVEILTRVLATNPYAITFRSLAELGPLDNYRVTLNASVYNRPTTSEVAGIWVEGNDNITAYERSIIVYGRSDYSQRIQSTFVCYDPLGYPLFFPNGEPGWHCKIPRHGVSISETVDKEENIDEYEDEANDQRRRKLVTMREYYCYKFPIRPDV